MYVRSSTKIPNFVLIKETSMATLGNFLFLLAVTLKMCETMGPNDLLHSAYDVCEVLLKDSGVIMFMIIWLVGFTTTCAISAYLH